MATTIILCIFIIKSLSTCFIIFFKFILLIKIIIQFSDDDFEDFSPPVVATKPKKENATAGNPKISTAKKKQEKSSNEDEFSLSPNFEEALSTSSPISPDPKKKSTPRLSREEKLFQVTFL